MQYSHFPSERLTRTIVKHNLQRKHKNWNIFAGDSEFKTNFFLKFLSDFTDQRFRKDTFIRFFIPIKAMIILYGILLMISYILTRKLSIIFFGIAVILQGLSFYLIRTKFTANHVRFSMILSEFLLKFIIFEICQNTNFIIFIFISQILTFIPSIFTRVFYCFL